MPSGGGPGSDSDVFLTPHANAAHPMADDVGSSPTQQMPNQAPAGQQSPIKAYGSAQLGTNAAGSTSWQQNRPAPGSPHSRLDLPASASAPVGPPTGPPSTPERPHPSTSDKFSSPQQQQQQQPQVYHRSPSSLLSRASARIRVALEASEAAARAGPADPPPRQPGLPPSSGHRRAYSQQVCSAVCLLTGLYDKHLVHSYKPYRERTWVVRAYVSAYVIASQQPLVLVCCRTRA